MFRFVTGKLTKTGPVQVKVKIPVGCLGDRGTEAEVEVAPDGSGYVKLFSGELEVTPNKPAVMFVLTAKHTITFNKDGTFSSPELFVDSGDAGDKKLPGP